MKQKYTQAMELATKEITKGKNLETNKHYLKTAADSLSQQTLRAYNSENSNSIKSYKQNQNKFNHVLTKIGDSNIKTKGLVADSYNNLCDVKYEIDLKIVDYYYQEGRFLLNKSKQTNERRWARKAYYEFINSEKEGASNFYSDLGKLKKDCLDYGSVLVSAPHNLNINNKFVIRKAKGDNREIDCRITIHEGSINITESTDSEEKKLSKKVVVGQKAITDTSGVTTYEDIEEKVYAYKHSDEITFTATQKIRIDVHSHNSECFLNSRTVHLEEKEICIEIEFTGDSRVYSNSDEESCNEFFIKNKLESEIDSKRKREMYIN